ncbi:hypothetical protein MC885_001653 [Smutsia gigantea]|nr:hypothetical protein MC885_001653 [Smutsia gigantea]
MNDEDFSTVDDTVQNERVYEVPDQPEENEGPLYDDVHEDLGSENNVVDPELETPEYDPVSVCAVGGEESSAASSQPEEGGYLLPDETCPEAQHLQPGEPQQDRDISKEELRSPAEDQEPGPKEPQENGRMVEEDLPSPSNFTVQRGRTFFTNGDSPTCYSAADGLEENKSASMKPEIILFVKKVPCTDVEPDRSRRK